MHWWKLKHPEHDSFKKRFPLWMCFHVKWPGHESTWIHLRSPPLFEKKQLHIYSRPNLPYFLLLDTPHSCWEKLSNFRSFHAVSPFFPLHPPRKKQEIDKNPTQPIHLVFWCFFNKKLFYKKHVFIFNWKKKKKHPSSSISFIRFSALSLLLRSSNSSSSWGHAVIRLYEKEDRVMYRLYL